MNLKNQFLLCLLTAILIVQFVSCSHVPKPPDSIADISELEDYLGKLVETGNPPGMSLVVVKDTQIVYSKGFGWADVPRKIPATSETIYHWWSCTKIPTAIAILQLQEEGKLNINDPVVKYLPFFHVEYPSTDCEEITILNLLNHTSGIPDLGFRIISMIHHEGTPPVNQTELVKKVLPDYAALKFKPGSECKYTNVGYMVLGAVIEKITGITYEDYIRQNILKPLEMKSTDFLYTDSTRINEACGSHPMFNFQGLLVSIFAGSFIREVEDGSLWLERVYTDQTPSTGLIGPASDAANLAIAYLNEGKFNNRQILSKESVAVMNYEGQFREENEDPQNYRRQGIGWQLYGNSERWVVTHEGGGPGFRVKFQLYPDEKLGFILFFNDVTCETWQIINLAATLKW